MASRPGGSRAGSRDRLNEPGAASEGSREAYASRPASRPASRAPSQERLLEAPAQPPPPRPAARPASVAGHLESNPIEALYEPLVPAAARRGSREMLDAGGGPRPPPVGRALAASREDLGYSPRQQEPLYQPAPYAAAVVRSASRDQLDPESSLYAPRSVPRSASKELLDRGTSGGLQPPGYERRFQTNASAANLYGSKNIDSKSRSSSVASLSAVGQPAPKYSQKPYFPNYSAQRYSRPKHISTTREPGYYNLTTDTVVRTRKFRTRTYMYVGRPWTKGFSTTPRNFLALAVVSFFFCPPLGIVALVYAVMSKRAAVEENNAAAGRYGVIAFRMSVATMLVGMVCWIALVALINGWRFIAHRIH